MKYFLILLSVVCGFGIAVAKPVGGGTEANEMTHNAMVGIRMSADDAKDLEEDVAKKPNDLAARCKLLGYYFMKRRNSAEAKEAYREHVLWIIKNQPEADIAATPFCGIDPVTDSKGYEEAKQLWAEQVKKHEKDALIAGNAARFLIVFDKDQAEKMFKQAKELDPKNPAWPDQLGHLYALQKNGDSGAKSLAEYEQANAIDTADDSKSVRLVELANSAFEAGEIEKAKKYAEELLKTGTKDPQNWNYGNAIHAGNCVLGRIALKEGHIPEANEYLLKAGETPGSPQLNSFGPNMTLAKELIEAGQKDVVLRYFAACRKFWKMGGERLDEWTTLVEGGKVPEFGGNLMY